MQRRLECLFKLRKYGKYRSDIFAQRFMLIRFDFYTSHRPFNRRFYFYLLPKLVMNCASAKSYHAAAISECKYRLDAHLKANTSCEATTWKHIKREIKSPLTRAIEIAYSIMTTNLWWWLQRIVQLMPDAIWRHFYTQNYYIKIIIPYCAPMLLYLISSL